MKTNISSIWRPCLRVSGSFVIAGVALLAMPRKCDAQQLYVTNMPGGAGVVSEYNAETGEVIKAKFITGLTLPYGLAVKDDWLFVVDETGFVGKYDATTGAAISPSFITKGLSNPFTPAVLGNSIYVTNLGDGTGGMILAYNAVTGAPINLNLITTLDVPVGLVLSGNELFVSDLGNSDVGKYNANTGKAIKAGLISGLNAPAGLALKDNELFVADSNGFVGKYDAGTGAVIKAKFIKGLGGPNGLALLGDRLFVTNYNTGTVGEYATTTGAPIHAHFITGLKKPLGIAVRN
jgi:DNA-binding beta-propeller fold protein YncE